MQSDLLSFRKQSQADDAPATGRFAAKADGHDNVQELTCVVAMNIGIEVTAAARTDDIGDLVRNCPVIGKL